jgi:hypothetical protein
VAGWLILVSVIAYGIGSELLASLLDAPDVVASVQANQGEAMTGMLLELLCAAAVIGVAATLFPILARYSAPVALGYVGFRIVEAVTIVIAAILFLAIVSLGEGRSEEDALADSLVSSRLWAADMTILRVSLAYLLLFAALYRFRLVPPLISAVGVAGLLLLVSASLVEVVSGNAGVFYKGEFLQILFAVPAGLAEFALAFWLVLKGIGLESHEAPTRR